MGDAEAVQERQIVGVRHLATEVRGLVKGAAPTGCPGGPRLVVIPHKAREERGAEKAVTGP